MFLQTFETTLHQLPVGLSHQKAHPLVDARSPEIDLPSLLHHFNRLQDVVMRLESSPLFGREPLIASVNQAFETLAGYSQEEAVGQPLTFLHGPLTQLSAWNRLQTAFLHHESVREEVAFYDKTGEVFWLELDVLPLGRHEGDPVQWLMIGRNVTERKIREDKEKEIASLETVRQLSAGVAHNFNNLLMVMVGYSEMVLNRLPASDPNRAMIGKIQQASQQMAHITNQLVAFGHNSFGNPKPVDPNQAIENLKSRIQALLGDEITLFTELSPNLETILVDPFQLEQALVQLTLNARDAMPNGGLLLIETKKAFIDRETALRNLNCKSGWYIELLVADTGTGMKPEVKAHVFEPFFSTKGSWEGSGLGLSTVYGIMKQYGGLIEVSSQEQCGTQFRLLFPVSQGQTEVAKDWAAK